MNAQRIVKRAMSTSSSPLGTVYNVLLKRNSTYWSALVIACIGVEFVYGNTVNGIWNTMNYGRTYNTVDWSKWKTEDEE